MFAGVRRIELGAVERRPAGGGDVVGAHDRRAEREVGRLRLDVLDARLGQLDLHLGIEKGGRQRAGVDADVHVREERPAVLARG